MIRKSTSSGFTLIELLAVISISGIVTVLAILWLTETLKFSARIRTRQHQNTQLARLARDFRLDVQSSKSMKLRDQQLVLTRDDGGEVIYSIEGHVIKCQRLDKGTITQQEQYQLASGTLIKWDIEQMPETVSLVVFRNEFPTRSPAAKQSNSNQSESAEGKLIFDAEITSSVNRWPVNYDPAGTSGANE